jgi:nitroreductase
VSVVGPPVIPARADDPDRVALAITEIARWAPSVHNSQPWSWRMRHRDLELRADRKRQLTVSDPDGRNLTISCGAALHYTIAAAEVLGWDTDVELLPTANDPDLMARIRLAPGEVPRDARDTLGLLQKRCTDRRRFTNWPIPPDRLRQLIETVRVDAVDVVAVSEPVLRWRVERLVDEARHVQDANPLLVAEQRRWTERGHEDDIPGPALSVVAPVDPSNLHRWGSRFDTAAPVPVRQPEENTDGLLAVATRTDDVTAWLLAGTAMTGLWLRATAEGLSVVPLSQVVEVPDTRAAIAHELLADGRSPQILLRIGWQEIGRGGLDRTPRRSVDELLRD